MGNLKISLKAARVNAKLSTKQAAEAIGVTDRTLRNWEKEKTYPSTDYIKKIEEAYNISIANIRFSS